MSFNSFAVLSNFFDPNKYVLTLYNADKFRTLDNEVSPFSSSSINSLIVDIFIMLCNPFILRNKGGFYSSPI